MLFFNGLPNTSRRDASRPAGSGSDRGGFTLIEVLAALMFMAIVLPVAVDGLRVANLAGQVAVHKNTAARVGERVMHELQLTGQLQGGSQSGVVLEGEREYQWTVFTSPWAADTMSQVTLRVIFQVQGRDYDVQLSTLISPRTL